MLQTNRLPSEICSEQRIRVHHYIHTSPTIYTSTEALFPHEVEAVAEVATSVVVEVEVEAVNEDGTAVEVSRIWVSG